MIDTLAIIFRWPSSALKKQGKVVVEQAPSSRQMGLEVGRIRRRLSMAVVRANQMVLLARLGMVGERSAMARRRRSSSSWVREVLLIIATPMPGLVCLAPVRAVPHVPHLAEEHEAGAPSPPSATATSTSSRFSTTRGPGRAAVQGRDLDRYAEEGDEPHS